MDGDKTSLHAIATALLQLQGTYGAPTLIRGKGPGAAVVKDTLLRLQQELGSQAPVPGGRNPDIPMMQIPSDG